MIEKGRLDLVRKQALQTPKEPKKKVESSKSKVTTKAKKTEQESACPQSSINNINNDCTDNKHNSTNRNSTDINISSEAREVIEPPQHSPPPKSTTNAGSQVDPNIIKIESTHTETEPIDTKSTEKTLTRADRISKIFKSLFKL